MSHTLKFGVQSYCFRQFRDNTVVAQKIRGIGLDQVEICAIHGDFSNPEAFVRDVAPYQNAGISIISLGVQTFEGKETERAWFECAAAVGAKHISAHFKPDSYLTAIPKVRKWSREFGIRVGIHCHGGYTFGGSPDVIDHLIGLGGPEIGICIDTAWVTQIGPYLGKPVEWAKRYAGSIYGVHFKDFTYARNGQWEDVIVGTGNVDLPAFVQALNEGGFDGMAVVEYEGDAENPDPALKKCVESMRAAIG